MDPVFVKGMAAFLAMMVVFVGSVWLLLAMVLGWRLGYFVMASVFFATMALLSAIWAITALGPTGPDGFFGSLGEETSWHQVSAGPDLSKVESEFGEFDVSDYPSGDWEKPSDNGFLADLTGKETTGKELDNVRPVLESLVGEAVSEIPGKRKEAAKHVQGEIKLNPENFHIVDVMMKQASVKGKDSIVALGKAVPSDVLTAGAFGAATEGEVEEFLVEVGDTVKVGDPIMKVKTKEGETILTADKPGKMIRFGFKLEDKIKPSVPFATVDVSGQPGIPEPVEVAAVRVRGSVRMPSIIYLLVSLAGLAVHLLGLSRVEKRMKTVTQTA